MVSSDFKSPFCIDPNSLKYSKVFFNRLIEVLPLYIPKTLTFPINKSSTLYELSNSLSNTFEYFSELGSMQNGLLKSDDTDEIHDSQYTKDETNIMSIKSNRNFN